MRLLVSLAIFGFLLCAGPSSAQLSSAGAGCAVNCSLGSPPTQIMLTSAAAINSGTATTLTTTVDVPVGSLIVNAVNVSSPSTNQSISTCTDNAPSGSNTYTIIQHAATVGVLNAALCYSITVNDLPVGSKFTVTTSGGGQYDFKGGWTSSGYPGGLDVSAAVNQATPGTSVAGLSTGTLSNSTDLVIGYAYVGGTGAGYTITPSAGFINLYNNIYNSIDYALPGALTSLAYAPSWTGGSAAYSAVVAAFSPTGQCSQATSLLARMDGTENTNAIVTAVCGMVADGTFQLLDGIDVFAINSTSNALHNWVSATYDPILSGSCTFTVNQGYNGDGSSCFIATQFIPSSAAGNMTLNSADFGICVFTSRAGKSNNVEFGVTGSSTGQIYFNPRIGSNFTSHELNGNSFPGPSSSSSQGMWTVTRTSSSTINLYRNGSSVASGESDTSVSLPTHPISILAFNNNGTEDEFSTDQIGAAFWGSGLTATQVTNIYNRLHTYFTTIGAPSGC